MSEQSDSPDSEKPTRGPYVYPSDMECLNALKRGDETQAEVFARVLDHYGATADDPLTEDWDDE